MLHRRGITILKLSRNLRRSPSIRFFLLPDLLAEVARVGLHSGKSHNGLSEVDFRRGLQLKAEKPIAPGVEMLDATTVA